MEIMWVADTLHSIYKVPCNLEGEPEFLFAFKPGFPVTLRFEVRGRGGMKAALFDAD